MESNARFDGASRTTQAPYCSSLWWWASRDSRNESVVQFKNQATARQRKRAGRLGALALCICQLSIATIPPALSIQDFVVSADGLAWSARCDHPSYHVLTPELSMGKGSLSYQSGGDLLLAEDPRSPHKFKAHYEIARGLSSQSCGLSCVRQLPWQPSLSNDAVCAIDIFKSCSFARGICCQVNDLITTFRWSSPLSQ